LNKTIFRNLQRTERAHRLFVNSYGAIYRVKLQSVIEARHWNMMSLLFI